MEFREGQYVVCVNANAYFLRGILHNTPFAAGSVYRIELVGDIMGKTYLNLSGLPKSHDGRPSWKADRFRPLDDRRLDVFRRILTAPHAPWGAK